MHKTLFFDVKEKEVNFLKENLSSSNNVVFTEDPLHRSPEKYAEEHPDTEIISVFTTSRVSAEIISMFPNLKLITTRSTGYSHIDIEYCKNKNIPVLNVPRYGDCTVAEFAFGLLLAVCRKINIAHENLKVGVINSNSYIGSDLFEKTIGIIGTGAIGSNIAKIANGFSMKILAFDPFPKHEIIAKYSAEYVSFEELISKSDIISLNAPATKENFHLIDEKAFSKMKNGVIIINTARGEIIDTEALYKALLSGKVASAGLDVLECEEIIGNEDDYLSKMDCIKPECLAKTLLNHRLLELPNVIVTPHIAFDTTEAIIRILETTIINITGFEQGNFPNRVN